MVARNLGGEGQVTDMLESRFESVEVVSAELEMPKIVLSVPWALSLIVIRDCIQWSSVLRIVSRDDTDNVRIRPHDDSGVACRNTPPPIVSDDARYVVNPAIEIKT